MTEQTFRRNIAVYYLFQFLKNLQFFGAVAVPFYLDRAGVDYTRMFTLEAFFVVSVFLLEVPTGVIADHFGRKASLIAGCAASAAGFVLFGTVNHYGVFFLANFLCAVGMTCFSGADTALLHDTLLAAGKADQGRHYQSRAGAFASAGMMVGPLAGAVIVSSGLLPYPFSLSFVFTLSGLVFLPALLAAFMLSEPPRVEKVENPLAAGWNGFLTLFRHKKLRATAVNATLVSAVTFFVFWFYQSLNQTTGLPAWVAGMVCAGFNGLGMVLLWNAARLEKALGLNRMLLITAVVPGLAFLGLAPFFQNPAVTLPLVFVIAGMKMLRGPLMADLLNAHIESRNRATVLSGVSMMERAVIGLLYPVVGLVADRSLPLVFVMLGVTALAFALLTRLPHDEKAADAA